MKLIHCEKKNFKSHVWLGKSNAAMHCRGRWLQDQLFFSFFSPCPPFPTYYTPEKKPVLSNQSPREYQRCVGHQPSPSNTVQHIFKILIKTVWNSLLLFLYDKIFVRP
eukprot:g52418.t1